MERSADVHNEDGAPAWFERRSAGNAHCSGGIRQSALILAKRNEFIEALAPLLPSFRGHYLSPKHLAARDDPRQVVSDPRARYYGVEVSERTLIPADAAQLGETHVVDWLRQTTGRCRDQRMEWWYAVTERVPRNQREW